jgi:CheY-like chemotaxis protein
VDEPIRVLVVDDHAVVREGLRTFLERRMGSRSPARRPTVRRPSRLEGGSVPTSS